MNYTAHTQSEIASFLATLITEELQQGRKVLWLLSGGSGGAICVEASRYLAPYDLTGLYVSMSDERYGPLGHEHENFHQLVTQGLMLPGATLYRPLTGDDPETTTQKFASWLKKAYQTTDYHIALFGIGADGHTSGIKPHSAAVSSKETAVFFTGDDFERITTTPVFLETFDQAVVQAFGADKHPTLKDFVDKDIPIAKQPAQLIKRIPNITVFSDLKEDKS